MTEVPEREHVLHMIGNICGLKFQRMHGVTQSELAERINRSPSTTTKTVQRMERAGFLERCPDPEDERVSRVYLTEAGRAIKADVEEVWRTLADQVFEGFTDEEVTVFYMLLQRMHHNLDREES